MSTTATKHAYARKPDWLKIKAPGGENYTRIKGLLRKLKLHTVCEEAHCPNVAECWGGGTATLMLLGDTCTRACRFCAVKSGNPGGRVDALEPFKVGRAAAQLGLEYIVLTAVDRDDLPDGGAAHFAETVRFLKQNQPDLLVETLIGDFGGDEKALAVLLAAEPDVLAHNVETVERLAPEVKDRRGPYQLCLKVLENSKRIAPHIYTKSSIMLGLGEAKDELIQAMRDLRARGVDFLTLGQYLRPSEWHLPVVEYVTPQVFKEYEAIGLDLGFAYVAAGPLVRSSYKAGEFFIKNLIQDKNGAHAR